MRDDEDDYERLMMPGNYLPRHHRDRRMPQYKPRLSAVYTSESPGYQVKRGTK